MGFIRKLIKSVSKNVNKTFGNKIAGKKGEIAVETTLNPWFFGKIIHKQINNYTIVDENNKTHQIDHIEIRQNGIFCIETKNYKGIILGQKNQTVWTQCLYSTKNTFINPLKQNSSHVYHLNKILDNKFFINSVVVFVQNNVGNLGIENVLNLCDLRDYLKNFNCGKEIYTIEEIENIYQTLKLKQCKGISNRQHVKNINETKKQLAQGVCPRCNGKLVLRNGVNGQFFGCSNYPKCKFTKNIN